MRIRRRKDVRLEDFSTEYQRMWSVHPTSSEHILIRNLTIRSTGGSGLKGAAAIDPPKLPDPVPAPARPYQLR